MANDRAGILVLDFVCSLASRCWSCVMFFLKKTICVFFAQAGWPWKVRKAICHLDQRSLWPGRSLFCQLTVAFPVPLQKKMHQILVILDVILFEPPAGLKSPKILAF